MRAMQQLRRFALMVGLLAGVCLQAAETSTAKPYFEALPGDLPIVITAPHGGTLRPDKWPVRTEGVTGSDLDSTQLAHAVVDELYARTGHHAALVASLLHRSMLDPNREIKEAAQGNAEAESAWRAYHAAIQQAVDAAVKKNGFAFLIDLHGHGHAIARLELGYALDAAQLNRSDKDFDASELITLSTLRDLQAKLGGSAAKLIRGPGSIGDLFTTRGFRAVPSPQDMEPGSAPFFSGGYTVRTYCAAPETTKVDGLQIETYFAGVRDTAEHRAQFAKATAEVLKVFLHERYHYELPVAEKK